MVVPVEPGTHPPDVEAAEASAFLRHSRSNEFLDGIGPIRTFVSSTDYVPMSTRNMGEMMGGGAPDSLRSLGDEQSWNSAAGADPAISPNPTMRRRANSVSSGLTGKRPQRLVAVRYFLDRPGYGLHNSAVRLWFEPPARCTPAALQFFLNEQGIALDDLLVEVYLDRFQSFMLLEACEAAAIEWNLKDTTPDDPGILNIRLTDVTYAARLDTDLSKSSNGGPGSAPPPAEKAAPPAAQHPHANTTPVGLFSFAMMVGLETAQVMSQLVPDFISPAYILAWGPYMFFVGGLLQIFTATLQVFRNNIYGAVAFYGFGSFWFANGTKVILESFFYPTEPADVVEELGQSDPWGSFIRAMYILAFTMTLLKQTFVMGKLSTTLIALLCGKIACQAVAGWSETLQWMQVVFGWLTSWFAFYVFLVEFTNQVYHREVFKTYKWSVENSPEEVFGAAGKGQTLYSKAARLRQARFPTVSTVRSAMTARRRASSAKQSQLHRQVEEENGDGDGDDKFD